tara:strand:- start:3616 stop:4143 length:528 start_codon:yes stop_codon:yes gene_type:complete
MSDSIVYARSGQPQSAAWWPEPPRAPDPDSSTPAITPNTRREFFATAEHALSLPRERVKKWYRHGQIYGHGERLAFTVVADAALSPPSHQTPSEWLASVYEWVNRNGNAINSELPPMPWSREPSLIAKITHTMHVGEWAAELSPAAWHNRREELRRLVSHCERSIVLRGRMGVAK